MHTKTSKAERAALRADLAATRRVMVRSLLVELLPRLGRSELTLAQVAVLFSLSDGEERRVSEVAATLGRSPSATSRLLDLLVRRGLLARREDPEDRRSRRIALAAPGRRLVASIMDRRTDAQLELMEALSAEERATVLAGMRLLAEAAGRTEARGGRR
ncbi:MAG: MarR family transcriptional regulator [Myxococcales bacterium]|nr:MarR family transcriptional regulator [Myxococcales bacterium]